MALLTTLEIKKKERLQPSYFVYFDEWTGEIKGITNQFKPEIKHQWIETRSNVAKELLLGNANPNKYIVADLAQGYELIEKKNLVHIKKAELTLTYVPIVKNTVESDINIIFYINNWLMEINISQDTLYKMTGSRFLRKLDENSYDAKHYLELFFIKNNNPLQFIKKISINPVELINNGYILYDLSEFQKYAGLGETQILTKRVFKNYGLKLKRNYTGVDYHSRKSLKRYYIPLEEKEETTTFVFKNMQGQWNFLSGEETAEDLRIYRDVVFYVFDKTPNDYISKITIPINYIGQKQALPLDINYDLSKYSVMTGEYGKNITLKVET